MKLEVKHAELKRDPDTGYVGQVRFAAENHPEEYEITLFSKKGKEWEYGLHFAETSGSEERIDQVEAYLEEDDDAFEMLVEAALAAEKKA